MSPPGLATFKDLLPQWTSGRVMHVKAPLGDGSHVLIGLVKEHNPTVAAALPGPAWVVKRITNLDDEFQDVRVEIVGSYIQKEQAFEAARNTMSRMVTGNPNAPRMENVSERGHLAIVADVDGVGLMVEATFDSGEFVNGSVNNQGIPEFAYRSMASCAGCGAQSGENGSPLKRCAKCKQVLYCGRECQRADYKEHKRVCLVGAESSTA